MKNKPQKHKTTNTFRYKSFADHVNEIDIRRTALYHIGHKNEEIPEENETHFSQALRKWTVLNLTDEYNQFAKQCHNIVTLPQLLHKKDFVVDLILEKLTTATTLSLQPVLEILVATARDLREDFYPYFQVILDKLIALLDTQDGEQLEWTLVCLAFLFKTLKPFLRKNINVVLKSILPVFDETRYPEHVINFSVECFAFVARDIKDYEKLLSFIMGSMKQYGNAGVLGMGRLFFEIIRGVNGGFHSTAETFLEFVFNSLINKKYKSMIFFEITEKMVENILNFTHPHNITTFWPIICKAASKSLSDDSENAKTANRIIILMQRTAEWKDGKYLVELEPIVSTILNIIDSTEDEDVLQSVSKLISLILLSGRAKVSQLDTSRLIRKVLTVSSRSVFEHFILSISTHSQFEILVLPDFLKYIEKYFDQQCLDALIKVILKKSPLCGSGINLEDWKPYPIAFKKTESGNKILEILSNFKIGERHNESLEEFLLCTILCPHVTYIDKNKIGQQLEKYTLELCKIIEQRGNSSDMFVLLLLVENLIHLNTKLNETFFSEVLEAILPHCTDSNLIPALKTLDLILSIPGPASERIITAETFKICHQKLSQNLYSSCHEIRLLSSHGLNNFTKNKKIDIVPAPVYEIFYNVENITPNVHTYKDQLLHLQKISTESELFKKISASNEIKSDCLKFLLGLLYHNFKLLWEPVTKIIEEYASEFDTTTFWEVFKDKIEETADIINGNKATSSNNTSEMIYKNKSLKDLYEEFAVNIENIDFMNYRNLLWGCLPKLSKISEIKNREIVPLFLKFVNEEYKKTQENFSLTWNVLSNDIATEMDVDGEDEDVEIEVKPQQKSQKKDKNIKATISTLIVKLGVFTKLDNPKRIHRENELYDFYLELLSGPVPHLQKLALDCIMAYKKKFINPYKDHLYSLIDDTKFKETLVNLNISKESETIQPEHRQNVLEILLRILYGKMISKSSNKNISSQVRKSIILRFLSGCDKNEIFLFLKMAFGLYEDILQSDLHEIPEKASSNFSLEKVLSPKKMQSTINTLEMIRKQFGGLMDDEFLEYLLKLNVFVGWTCENVLDNSETVNPKIVAVFKNLKSLCLISLVNFFDHFQNFKWDQQKIMPIFKVFVHPKLDKLASDSIHSPTPLLKLLYVWTQSPKHFWLLTVKHPSQDITPISSAIDLLLNEKSKPIIRSTIMEMIERLLTASSTDTSETSLPIVSGISVVTPHISKILDKLRVLLKQKGQRRGLDKRELNILSHLTNLVEDPEACDSLLELLLPILVSKSRVPSGEESVSQALQTLSNLLSKVNDRLKYIRSIAPLFEQMSEVSTRKQLCNLLLDIARKCKSENSKLLTSAKIVNELNAWDKRWVEQPDYDKRLGAISVLKRKLDEGEVDIDLGLLVIYNCFYFVKYDKDMGLRDNASEFLKQLIPKLVTQYKGSKKDIDFLVGDVVVNLVRRTIRDKNDNVRNEGIQLFGEIIRECPYAHPILQDLYPVTDKQDREVDFFDNITHLQSYRHGRALLKFCSVAKTLEKAPTPRTLTQFVLPLATRYLMSEKFASKHTLIDAAIETIGVVCRFLPWHHYHAILKFYLQRMKYNREYQKQLVRIVVAILDAFHFDLTSATGDLRGEIEDLKKKVDKIQVSEEKEDSGEEEDNDKDEPSIKKKDEDEDDDLDSELDEICSVEPEDAGTEINEHFKKVAGKPVFTKITRLSPSNAKTVIIVISRVLIPTLNNSITNTSRYDQKHKVNRRKRDMEREEEEILRVPIALALIKLLQKLPTAMLETSLPGVFMKVCTFLKSPLKSVRMCARDILKKIMLTLSAKYLSVLLEKLTSLLTRGFQVHVLSVTVHGVLDCLKEQFQPGDLEACLQNILEVTLNDVFGDVAAEKEIAKIGIHTPEAKTSAKSYLTLHIVARNIQESCLLDLLMPFKEHLAKSQSRRVVGKIQDCFQRIVSGLVENKNLSQETLLIFIYGILSESITDLLPGKERPTLSESDKEKMRRARPDCFLIPEQPKYRSGAVRKTVKTNSQANAHVLIELGLEMLHILLKRKKIAEINYEPFMNPLVPIVKDSLKSSHIRVTTFALKCLAAIWNEGYELQAIVGCMDELVEQIFAILHKYTSFDTTKKDDNFQLVKSAFKSVVALLRKCDYYSIKVDYISQLILYIEQDMQESDKQPTAFSLLKSLVNRKIMCPEIHDIMQKLCNFSIVSESNYAREESRDILMIYVMEYPLKKKIDSILKFFTTQLNYSVTTGRLSAIQFLRTVVKKFPDEVLARKSEFLFLSLGTRLVNEEDPECRKATAECIEDLISKLEDDQKQKLFDINMLLLEGDKPAVREMAATLCSRFVSQEKDKFSTKAKIALPILIKRLFLNNPNAPGRFVKPILENGISLDVGEENNISEEVTQQKQRARDHELIQMQNCILKILENCPDMLDNGTLDSTIDDLAYESQRLLGYEHEWVRLNAAKILEKIIATYDPDVVNACLLGSSKPNELEKDFIYLNPENDLRSLTLDLCAQMLPGTTNEAMAEQVVKVLLYITNMVKNILPDIPEIKEEVKKEEKVENDGPKVNLFWVLRRIRYIVYGEVAKASHSCILRTAVFNWIDGILALLEVPTIEKLAQTLLSIVVREMSEEDQNIDPKLRQHAIRLGNKIRKRIGDEIYNSLRSAIQTKLMIKRAERRKLLAQEKVNDPVRAAKRKQGQQDRKKIAKRRKMDVMKGKIAGKKRKRKLEDDDLIC